MRTCPTFVINMVRDVERREHMSRELDAAGIRADFVAATDGRALSSDDRARYDARRAMRIYGIGMMDPEIGCYLSHYRLYERIVRENISVALILEDDLAISPTLPAIVSDLLADPDPTWLVVRFESKRGRVLHPRTAREHGVLVRTLRDGELRQIGVHVLGLGGYLIRAEGARRMLRYGSRIFMPIDQTMDRFWENGIVPYVVRPFPVRQRGEMETRSGTREPSRKLGQPIFVRSLRRLQRLADSVQKRLFVMRLARRQLPPADRSEPHEPSS
jgi:glycosyl transferase family 25